MRYMLLLMAAGCVMAGYVATASEAEERSDRKWFLLSPTNSQCAPLREIFGVPTPLALEQKFANSGRNLTIAKDNGDYIRLKNEGQPADPGIVLVRGSGLCELYLRTLQARSN